MTRLSRRARIDKIKSQRPLQIESDDTAVTPIEQSTIDLVVDDWIPRGIARGSRPRLKAPWSDDRTTLTSFDPELLCGRRKPTSLALCCTRRSPILLLLAIATRAH